MAAQTSYSINQGVALAGQLYALAPHDIVSRKVETVAGIEFGVAVSRGTDKNTQCVLGAADFIGITVRDVAREGSASGDIKYSETETAGVLRNGYLWVTCPSGATAGAAVKCNSSTGVIDAGTAGAGETQLDGAVWDTTAAAGEVGVIRLNSLQVTAGS